ncbi:MAG: 4-alpha-glucanotransferase [Gammaproteobacteria bacterium]|nr:4-alpha-glucanotransferase [Gammaproteobacteria bacterium]
MPAAQPLARRRAGILLHPTSLPGTAAGRPGDLGAAAYRFVDVLVECGQSVWQVLPLGPTHSDGSPYQSLSVHAGNPRLISIERLRDQGLVGEQDYSLRRGEGEQPRQVRLLGCAAGRFAQCATAEQQADYQSFRARHDWLEDYALFIALREHYHGQPWFAWPAGLRSRAPAALLAMHTQLREACERVCFEQYVFHQQWQALKAYANARGVLIFGDIPIFVAHDSADVWVRPELFDLDDQGGAAHVAGVPPDYFSATGQRWGNPLYRWQRLAEGDYDWWLRRIDSQLQQVDMLRIDHFRGFEAYWEIPGDQQTAQNGQWRPGPGAAFLERLVSHCPGLPLVAEDLGVITPQVEALRDRFRLPGMKILHFAFGGNADNPYLPHAHVINSVVYTGTHDNDTTLGWFNGLPQPSRDYVLEYLGGPQAPMPWPLISAALASVARLAIIPMQDVLELDSTHRMNVPGTSDGNWLWQFDWAMLTDDKRQRLTRLTQLYHRS